jgi:hypothetical protein
VSCTRRPLLGHFGLSAYWRTEHFNNMAELDI